VFVLGDSAAWNLHAQHPPRPGSGLLVEGSTQLGCDLLEGALVVDGRVQPVAEQCAAWPDSWRLQVGRQRPDVAVLVTGNGMLFDRRVDGRRVEFGSPSYRDVLRGFLDRTLRDLARTSTRVAVTTLPCFGKPDTGLDGTAAVVNDVRRQERFGELLRAELARHPRVALLDLRGHVCPGGAYREDLGGERLRTDGVHWSAGGARVVWRWLAPRLAAPQARPRQDAGRFRNGPSPRDAGPAPVRATPPSAPSPRTAGRTPEERSG
jgi:hypothetical protein